MNHNHTPKLPHVHTLSHSEAVVYLTPTHIHEYLFCPRFTYFEYVLHIPQYQEKRFKVQRGRQIHHERIKTNPNYLRKKLGVLKRQHQVEMASEKLHLKGIVDEVLWLHDGTMAPFDYKYAEWKGRIFKNLKIQSALYALLIRETFHKEVRKGFLCFTRSNYRIITLEFNPRIFHQTLDIIQQVFQVIQRGFFPPPTDYPARCLDCCYRNVCIK